MSKTLFLYSSLITYHFSSFFVRYHEADLALLNFFERDACRLVFERVDVDARARAALELLAPFRGDDNHAVFGIHLGAVRLLYVLKSFLNCFCHFLPNL